MVKKLFKHEFLAYARVMSVVYIILLSVATAGRVVQFFDNDSMAYAIVSTITYITYGMSIFAAFIGCFAFALVRFYKNLFTCEGYLSFTLPVTAAQHIWAKAITTLYFGVITVIVVLLSGCVITAGEFLVELCKAIGFMFEKLYEALGYQLILIGLEWILLFIMISLMEVLLYYTFITVGQLFKKNRVAGAVGVYFVFYLFTQVLSSVFLVWFSSFASSPQMEQLGLWSADHPYAAIHIATWAGIVLIAAFSLICFWVIRRIMTKKLNLE